MISPPNRSATASASALFPVAVGPRIATTGLFSRLAGRRRLLDTHQNVDDEDEQKNQKPELLTAGHRGVSL
jgi:hypothetical protein